MKKTHDIVGFWIAHEIVCLACVGKEEETTEDDAIYRKDTNKINSVCKFCDRCDRPLVRDS